VLQKKKNRSNPKAHIKHIPQTLDIKRKDIYTMDYKIPALQTYDGGIIFVSYIIAVVGAMTTLELLQRRTHIRGKYNWLVS
jgi:hypothetical protein